LFDFTVVLKIARPLLVRAGTRRGEFFRKLLLYALFGFAIFKSVVIISLFVFPLPEKLVHDFSRTYRYRDGNIAWISLNRDSQYRVKSMGSPVSPYLSRGIIEYEDRYFYLHPGINPVSAFRAMVVNTADGKTVLGASTVTMQLARLAEPKERTVWNKILEMLRSLQMETAFTKNEILSLYLDTIPMGENIQGVYAAAFFYFGKEPADLSLAEASLLIAINRSPGTVRPFLRQEDTLAARNKVIARLSETTGLRKDETSAIMDTPLPAGKHRPAANIIPLVGRLSDLPFRYSRTLAIDQGLQDRCADLVSARLSDTATHSGACIVVDNQTQEILAYIGSPDPTRENAGYKFNAAATLRQPGSTLKPFLYTKAIEQGLITERSRLFDIPMDFNGYKPRNFYKNYLGIIPADEALVLSLNIPAVALQAELGPHGLHGIFRDAGYSRIASRMDPQDLSVVLGSVPMNLETLVEMYSMFAHQGTVFPLEFFTGNGGEQEKRGARGVRLFSPEAVYITGEILSRVRRPDLPNSWEFTRSLPRIAFKTGTSYGFVDRWAVGFTPKYTIGVWVGKLDNRYSENDLERNRATEILFLIMDDLAKNSDAWFSRPASVGLRKVCSASGMVPSTLCPLTEDEYFIPGVSSGEYCSVHRKVVVERETGLIVPLESLEEHGDYMEKIIEIWDAALERFNQRAGKETHSISAEAKNVSLGIISGNIVVTSPTSRAQFVIDPGRPRENQKIPLQALGFADSSFLYWYANGSYLGRVSNGETMFYFPDATPVKFSVVDEKGRTGSSSADIHFLDEEM